MAKKIADFRKPEIVRALFAAVKAHGVSLPGYGEIATQGGMTRQLVRHYFPDPEDLAVALCNHLADSYRECLMRGILMAQKSERLNTFLDFYFGFLAEKGIAKPADDEVYDALVALSAASPRVRTNLRDQYRLLQATIAHEVQISHPTLPQRACSDLGFLLVALMYGHWKMVASLGFSDEMNRVSRDAMDRLIDSYVARWTDPDAED